ncbi:MAG: energy transducer TonB [Candidatus Firestonebacteria bacterium]|nr:energy transducer TonB [Candidatus Firestonebacteria bacterium]
MQKNGDLKYTIIISLLIHFLLLLWLSSYTIKASAGKTVYLTEITFLAEMPYGKGLGQKGKTGDTGIKNPAIKIAKKTPEIKTSAPAAEVVAPLKITPRSNEEIVKIRKENPIGMEETALKSAAGLIEDPSFGGGYGEDNLPPGSADGKHGIEGPIASRGILYRAPALYPEWARRKGIEGEIKAQIKVDSNGDVSDTIVIKTCGFKELDQVVIECMRKWKFSPLPFSANKIDQDGRITFKFNLKK